MKLIVIEENDTGLVYLLEVNELEQMLGRDGARKKQ